MRRPVLTLLFVSSLLSACSHDSVPTAPSTPSPPPAGPGVNTAFTLAPGESASVPEAELQLRFKGVTNDSRCPGDAICITGGEAVLAVDIQYKTFVMPSEIRTSEKAIYRVNGFTLEFEALSPYPFSSLPPIKAGDYRATFKVTAAPGQ